MDQICVAGRQRRQIRGMGQREAKVRSIKAGGRRDGQLRCGDRNNGHEEGGFRDRFRS